MRPLIADRRSRIHRSLGRSFLACLAQRKQMDAIFEGERLQRNQAPTLQISLSSQVQFLPPIAHRASLVYCRPRLTPGSANNIRYHMTSYMSHMFASFPSAISSQQKSLLGSFCFVPLFVSHSYTFATPPNRKMQTTNTVTTTNPNNVQQRPSNDKAQKN